MRGGENGKSVRMKTLKERGGRVKDRVSLQVHKRVRVCDCWPSFSTRDRGLSVELGHICQYHVWMLFTEKKRGRKRVREVEKGTKNKGGEKLTGHRVKKKPGGGGRGGRKRRGRQREAGKHHCWRELFAALLCRGLSLWEDGGGGERQKGGSACSQCSK